MSKAAKNIFIRVIKKRMKDGESLDSILESYPKLSTSELAELRKEFE